MLRIGLTGGIGSGKTTVAKLFGVLGIPVYYADDAAKRLMAENAVLKNEIIRHFGAAAYVEDILDRSYLGGIVFKDPAKLALLNALVHPATLLDAAQWLRAQTTPYAVKEAALIFESGAQKDLDYVIGVFAPLPLRVQRVMTRDHLSREDISARINKQIPETVKMKLCDFVIVNDEQQLVIPQVVALHEKLLLLNAPS
jgi:dephospho-CoA kinase